jgi:hypothetical protein
LIYYIVEVKITCRSGEVLRMSLSSCPEVIKRSFPQQTHGVHLHDLSTPLEDRDSLQNARIANVHLVCGNPSHRFMYPRALLMPLIERIVSHRFQHTHRLMLNEGPNILCIGVDLCSIDLARGECGNGLKELGEAHLSRGLSLIGTSSTRPERDALSRSRS